MSWADVRNHGWTDERVDTLKGMWSEGNSASQIARKLGGVTRNAVIGKVHRLGLEGRSNEAPRPRKTRVTVGGGMPKAARAPAIPKLKPADIIHADVLRIEASLPATDDPQSAAGCRWPIGEVGKPGFRYCQRKRGKRASGETSPWCEEHHALGHHSSGPVVVKKKWNGWVG